MASPAEGSDAFRRYMDPELAKIGSHVLDLTPGARGQLVQSLSASSANLEVSRWKFTMYRAMSACAALMGQRVGAIDLVTRVVQTVIAAGGRCVCFSEYMRFDESTMYTRVPHARSDDQSEGTQAATQVNVVNVDQKYDLDKVAAKLVQSVVQHACCHWRRTARGLICHLRSIVASCEHYRRDIPCGRPEGAVVHSDGGPFSIRPGSTLHDGRRRRLHREV